MTMTSGNPTPARLMSSLKAIMKSRQITYRDLARHIRLSEALRLIELRSKLRARTRAASVIAWRPDGPLRRSGPA